MKFVSINPATARRIRTYRPATNAEIEISLQRAHRGFLKWRETTIPERSRRLLALARVLRQNAKTLASMVTEEMGKPLKQSLGEIEKCATTCEFYAQHAARLLADEHPPASPKTARVTFAPLGPVLAIMPWNFPFWQVIRAAAPILTAGNTVLLKHSPNVSGCALAVADLLAEAGYPAGTFQTLLLPNEKVPAVIADERISGVTLTGSVRAGRIVGALAGHSLKKAVFELGGSDAYLILDDADLDKAAEICAESRLINSGQSCVCAKRMIVVASVRRAFEEKFVARMAARLVGDPREESTQVGPIARSDLRDQLDAQIRASVAAGAKVLLGAHAIPGRGYFYAPTVLTNVKPGMPAYAEELFGPAAAVITVPNEKAAIATANDSIYGLGSAVFSENPRRAARVASQLDAGQTVINDFVRSDPSLPFGGIKQSGHGRELGPHGMREFQNIKTISGT